MKPEPVLLGRFGQSENELLVCCARTRVTGEMAGRIQRLVQGGIDWDHLLQAAFRHKLLPLLYQHLRKICPDAVPKAVLHQLRVRFHTTVAWNLSRTRELIRLLSLLEPCGVSTLAFKGPTLGATAYEKLELRPFGDLDILIRRQELFKCRDLLLDQGYRPHPRAVEGRVETYLDRADTGVFGLERDGVVVELHWTLMPRKFSFAPFSGNQRPTEGTVRSGFIAWR